MVEGVDGFIDTEFPPQEYWLKDGYPFVEGTELGGEYARWSVQPDGTYSREKGIIPASEYIYEHKSGNIRDVYSRSEGRVFVLESGEALSRDINISYAGGWSERFVNGLYAARGNTGTCGPIEFLLSALSTVNRRKKQDGRNRHANHRHQKGHFCNR